MTGGGDTRAGEPLGWVGPLAATLTLQTTNAYLSYIIPTLAPVVSGMVGAGDELVGHLAALSIAGSMAFMLAGTPIIRRLGSIRSLQLGTLVAGLGVLLLLSPGYAGVIAATVLMGVGYGPSSPAGSDVLQRFAPARHRSLIFSIRQAGVPLSGVAAALLLPRLYEGLGWGAVILSSLALALLGIAAVEPLRARIDAPRDRTARVTFGSLLAPANLLAPARAVAATPGLGMVALAGACLAIGHGCWFAYLVTYLHQHLRLSLVDAGLAFAVMQGTGVVGRVLLGWLSDRLRSGSVVLGSIAVLSAATSVGLVAAGDRIGLGGASAIAALAGITVGSWNGVQIAEIARRAPRETIAASASGATILVFAGFLIGPAAFAVILDLTGSFAACFLATAAATLTGGLLVLAASRAEARRSAA